MKIFVFLNDQSFIFFKFWNFQFYAVNCIIKYIFNFFFPNFIEVLKIKKMLDMFMFENLQND